MYLFDRILWSHSIKPTIKPKIVDCFVPFFYQTDYCPVCFQQTLMVSLLKEAEKDKTSVTNFSQAVDIQVMERRPLKSLIQAVKTSSLKSWSNR